MLFGFSFFSSFYSIFNAFKKTQVRSFPFSLYACLPKRVSREPTNSDVPGLVIFICCTVLLVFAG